MAEIDKVFAGLNTQLRRFKEEFGVEIVRRVHDRTPVESGRLQRGWGFQMRQYDIEVYNVVEYATHVEFGTKSMAPRGMLRTTLLEANDIARVAAEKVKK